MKQWRKENKKRIKKYYKKWLKNNKEKCLEYHRKWRRNKNNREKELEHNKEYQRNNRDKLAKYIKKYRRENPEIFEKYREAYNKRAREWAKTEKGKANRQRGKIRRKAKEKEIINTLTSEEWLDILRKYKYKCVYCGCEFDLFNRPTRDHIVPISKNGDNVKENIVPACRSCNAKKSNKILLKRCNIWT